MKLVEQIEKLAEQAELEAVVLREAAASLRASAPKAKPKPRAKPKPKPRRRGLRAGSAEAKAAGRKGAATRKRNRERQAMVEAGLNPDAGPIDPTVAEGEAWAAEHGLGKDE